MPYVLILLSLCFSSFFLAAAEKSAKSGGLSDSFGSYDEEYFTAKNKATEGGEIVGDWEFTDRDRKINDARRKYGEDTTRFKSAVKEIRERDFLQRSKDIVDQKISQAVPDSLRHRILLGLRRKMDEAGFLSSFCKNIATLEEEIFRTKFDRQVQQLLYEWVSRYQTVSERTKTVERNSNFVNSETEEKSLRAALEELSKNRAQRFFHSGGPLPSLGQVEDINVGFSKIVRQANAVLTALPDRRLAYRGAEANKAAQKKARLERESREKKQIEEAEEIRLKNLSKKERKKEQEQKKQAEKEKQKRDEAVRAEQRKQQAIVDKAARAETWKNVKSGAATAAVKTGKCVGMLCVAPVAIPAYLTYIAGVGISTRWSEYQADAPNRERRRQEEKVKQKMLDRKTIADEIAYAKAATEWARREKERQAQIKEQKQAQAVIQAEKSRELRAARWAAVKSGTVSTAITAGKCVGYLCVAATAPAWGTVAGVGYLGYKAAVGVGKGAVGVYHVAGSPSAGKCVGYLCAAATAPAWGPVAAVGYAGYKVGIGVYHAGVSAASSWSEYQAAAPVRANERERQKEQHAHEKAKRKEATKARKIAEAEKKRESTELAAERQRTKKERKQAWLEFQAGLTEAEKDTEKRDWIIKTLDAMRKKELINLAVERDKLEPVWISYQRTLQKIREEKEELEARTEEKSELGEQLRQHQLKWVTKWLVDPKYLLERRASWEALEGQLRNVAQNTTMAYNRKFLSSKKPRGIRITSREEEGIWKSLQFDKKQQENLTSISFVDDITSTFEKKKMELRRTIKTKEIVGISRKAKEISVESEKKPVAPIVPFALTTDVLATDDNFRLIEEGPAYLRVLLVEAGKNVEEISAMLAQGLWEVFLQMRKKGSALSPELALKSWNVMEERKKKRKPVDNIADISLAYIDRLQVLADEKVPVEKTVLQDGVVSDKSVPSENGSTVRTRAETEKRFAQNTYHPFTETVSYVFDPSVVCAICGNEQRFVVRPLQVVSAKNRPDGNRMIQIPLPGTSKLSTCGHMICTTCLEAHRKEKLRKVDPYECPQCNAPIPYWELDSVKWVRHFGLDYRRVAHEAARSFQDLRMEELEQMFENFRSRLIGRLAGNGLELEGTFYRKIGKQRILSVAEQRKWIENWAEKNPKEVFSHQSEPLLPPNPERETASENEKYEKYMEEIQEDFSKYEAAKEALRIAYQDQIVKLAWEMQKPSIQSREVRRHLNQYEFVFPEEKVTTKSAYARFSFHRDSATEKFMHQVENGIITAEIASREDFLSQMKLPRVPDAFSIVNEGFTATVDNQLLVFNGSEAYRDFAYEALEKYAKEEQYHVKEVIEKSDLQAILAENGPILSKEKEQILANITERIEAEAGQLEKAYSILNWQDEAAEAAYVEKVEKTKIQFSQILGSEKFSLERRVVSSHYVSYLNFSIHVLAQEFREVIYNSRPKDMRFWQIFDEARSSFRRSIEELLTAAQRGLKPESFTEEEITSRITAMQSAYQVALAAYKEKMDPILSHEQNAAEFQDSERQFDALKENNWFEFTQIPHSRFSREDVFLDFQDKLNREIHAEVKTRNLSLDVLRAALKRQKSCAKKIQILQKWKSHDVGSGITRIETNLSDLAHLFSLQRVLSHPEEIARSLEIVKQTYQETYARMTNATHYRDQTAESYVQAYEQLEQSLEKIGVDRVETLFSSVLAEKGSTFSLWSRVVDEKRIKDLLAYIAVDGGKIVGSTRVGASILSYIGWYILGLNADSRATKDLVTLYQDTHGKMESFLGELTYEVPVFWNQSENTGLHNFGATCYLNTIYQSFATSSLYPLLSPYRILEGESAGRELRQNRALQKAIYRVVNALRNGESVEILTPMVEAANTVVWQTFSHVDRDTSDPGMDAQVPEYMRHRDAEEFLRYTLAALKGDERTGVTQYRVRKHAQTEEMNVEPQRHLILPLGLVGGSISDILRQTNQAETADGEDGKPTHYFWGGFSTLPSTLVISLKRFELDDYGLLRKNTTPIHIPHEIEVAADPVDSTGESNHHDFSKKYRLVGSYLHHMGEDISAGHYTFVTPDKKGNWIEHDDKEVVYRSGKQDQIAFQTYVEENAYVVIYEEVK